jgi:hypothetical protein
MRNFARVCRRMLKRHAEAIFITIFILCDCFLSGWALTVGVVAAILYAVMPAVRALPALDPKGRLTYLKGFVKTPRLQRVAILLLWICSIRWLLYAASASYLFTLDDSSHHVPTISSALYYGALQFAPLAFLGTPFIVYAAACVIAILSRSRLKPTKQDPDLVTQRQRWSLTSQYLFLSAFIGSILSITLNPKGPAYMLSNWLLASARDANLYGQSERHFGPRVQPFLMADPVSEIPMGDLSFIQPFDTFILTASSIVIFLLLYQAITRLNALLMSSCWRVVSVRSAQNIIEGFLEALRLPSRQLSFNRRNPFLSNALRTLLWLIFCYAALFWIFGFCGGPIGNGIQSWMVASGVDAGFGPSLGAPEWLFGANYRIFLGSIVALYATAPVAITGAVFLPFAQSRKIIINSDGILFSQGPFLTLYGRQFRLWSDLQNLSVVRRKKSKSSCIATFTLEFRSGGRVSFDSGQIPAQDLQVLLDNIDERANACSVDSEVLAVCRELLDAERDSANTDGIEGTDIPSASTKEFTSTVFVPLSAGDFLPGTKTRIIKQLASKPLCAVYLAREAQGRMVTVKQFYLADENEETRALEKILRREYDLLSQLDHTGISKVVNSFTDDKSTFLVIEHRIGSDLRAIVNEHGARSESLTISWARQLCEILTYLHNHEPAILHRDITPDNIIAGEDGQLRLIDFGASRVFLEGVTGTMIGKHCYVAPEQLRGDATKCSDIYSFGATLYFLLTGSDPVALSQSSPASRIECSEALDQLIRDCTEFDQDKRPQSFDEINQRLAAIDKGVRIKFPSAQPEAVA